MQAMEQWTAAYDHADQAQQPGAEYDESCDLTRLRRIEQRRR
jgi:hypothetical protein